MPDPRACSRCGAALAPGIEGPICPACLIEAALAESNLAVTETVVSDGTPTGQTARTPDRVGAYQILTPLGEGGMGVVYLAEQAAPIRRRVALKLIKLGMDTHQVVARFDAERQALALMDHPNIASVFDAGATDDGRPYFVMEYVPGLPITEFSDRHQLSTRARLELFQQVCAAVQHAHQKGVIHRDLKPSNVLVMEQDGRPVPKVIDFGIAKATDQHVTEKTLFTEHGLFVGTPEYMSPEQADATIGDVDTRSDIYSLGMILYELLVGGLPFSPAELRQAGYAEIQRIIREREPPKPSTSLSSLGVTATEVASRRRTNLSTLARDLRGDLDWITLKSIEKDRNRRYASASELAADIGRHLRLEPVAAGPPRASYRLRKFVRKHRGAVAAWAALLLLLAAGLLVSATLYVRAERSRQDADRQRSAADVERSTAQTASQEANRQRQAAQTERAAAETQRKAAETERDEALYQNYRSALLAADLSLQSGEIGQARQQLQAADPRLRGWEWRYLARLADSSIAATSVFTNQVREVRFSKNGNAVLARGLFGGPGRGVLVLPDRARELSVTRVTSGNLASPSRLDLGQRLVAISPDGTRVLSAGWSADDYPTVCERREADSSGAAVCQPSPFGRRSQGPLSAEQRDRLIVRDMTTGKDVATLTHPNLGVWTTAQSPAGKMTTAVRIDVRAGDGPSQSLLATNMVRVAVAGSQQPLAKLSGWLPEVAGAAFSADGLRVATWSWDNLIYVWDVASQSILTTLRGHRDGIRSVCFNTTANRLVSASFDGTIRLWAVPGGTQLQELPMPGASTATYAPNGANIAVGTDSGVIQILDGSAGQIVRALPGHTTSVISLAFSPDSTRLASAAFADRTARLWDVSTGGQLLSFSGHEEGVTSVAFRPDGDVVASGSMDGTVRFWNARGAGSILTGHTRSVAALKVANPGGPVISVSNDGTVRVWDPVSGRSDRLDLDRGQQPDPIAYDGLTMRPPRVAVPSGAGSTKVLDIPSGKTLMEVTHEPLAQTLRIPLPPAVAISPDGARLAIGTSTGSGAVIRMWRIPSGRLTATWTLAGAGTLRLTIVFDRHSRRIAVAVDARSPSDPRTMRGQILVLDESSPTPVDSFFVPYLPTLPVFLPDDSGVLYAFGEGIHLWDFRRRAEVAVLSHPASGCPVIAVTPDGSRILAGCSDATLRVWDAGRRQLLLTIRLSGTVRALAVSPDGSRIAAGLANGQIQILDAGVVRDILKRHP